MNEKIRVTRGDIKQGLSEAGLRKGDTVLVHSSLSKFGYVEGGADSVVDALLQTVGQGGTVAVPSFNFSLGKDGSVFEVMNTPSEMGKVSEALRKRNNAPRSHHLTHSIAALGYKAKELTETHSVTPCGQESPFRKLVSLGGHILLLGVSQNINTTFHAIEEEKELFYVRYKEIKDIYLIDENGLKSSLPTQIHQPLKKYDFNRMDRPLLESGAMKITVIGESLVRLINAKSLYDFACECVRKDPNALLRQEEEVVVPTSIDEIAGGLYSFLREKG